MSVPDDYAFLGGVYGSFLAGAVRSRLTDAVSVRILTGKHIAVSTAGVFRPLPLPLFTVPWIRTVTKLFNHFEDITTILYVSRKAFDHGFVIPLFCGLQDALPPLIFTCPCLVRITFFIQGATIRTETRILKRRTTAGTT